MEPETGLPHTPVMAAEVVEGLATRPGGRYIDGTLGAGGHAAPVLAASGPDGKLLGLDGDPDALEIARKRLEEFGSRAILVRANFNQLHAVAAGQGFIPADGVLLDLGLSSMQLSDPSRGFSFAGESLDMRMDPRTERTAADLVNELDEADLADLIYRLGEEHLSRRIAAAIVGARPIESAKQLAQVIERTVGRRGRIHPATRTFQALRIEVNHELENLEQALAQLGEVLRPGGRAAIITFQSLEDRIVKYYFKENEGWRILTKHPIRPTYQETRENSRSRSSKLRVVERL